MAVHGVPCVDGHVDDGGFELAGVGVDEAGLVRSKGDNLDAGEPISVRIISLSICTLRPTSNISGFSVCRRANASNCAVSLAARVTVSEIAST